MCDEETRTRFQALDGKVEHLEGTLEGVLLRLEDQEVQSKKTARLLHETTKRMSKRDSAIFKQLKSMFDSQQKIVTGQTQLQLSQAKYQGGLKAVTFSIGFFSLMVTMGALWMSYTESQDRERALMVKQIINSQLMEGMAKMQGSTNSSIGSTIPDN